MDGTACIAEQYPYKMPGRSQTTKLNRYFAHSSKNDGVHDLSCMKRFASCLIVKVMMKAPIFLPNSAEKRNLANHLWPEAYNRPILDFYIFPVQNINY